MSLINYIEPANAGQLFSGLGTLIVSLVAAYLIYMVMKPVIGYISCLYNRETRYEIIESKVMEDVAKEKGIDLEKEMIKREVFSKNKKSIRDKIEAEMFEKMFPGDKDKKD